MLPWTNYILQLSALIGALGTVGGALIWLYRKLVSEPDRKMAEKIQRENNKVIQRSIEPLTKAIDQLNYNLEDSKRDRNNLNKQVNNHGHILNNHETRIAVLEDWRKGK